MTSPSSRATSVIVCAFVVLLAAPDAHANRAFDAWRAAFGVTYGNTAEAKQRAAVFAATLRTIEAHNANGA